MTRIERLSENVVNRIAAGEVVQRPSGALKELLENALDAGSSSIQVLVENGGLDVLQVTDDGQGICYEDLPLLCERYATSKLRTFEDLTLLSSFGFRGEALSSISYVSRVTVTTMTRVGTGESSAGVLAWRCHFMDGVMQGEPKPCAGNPGTCIRVEKMFYNAAVRRQALNRPSEEYGRIVAVVSRYALAFPHVAFSCRRDEGRKSGSCGKADVFFPKESSTLSNIRLFFGAGVASHMQELHCVGVGIQDATPSAVMGSTGEAGGGRFLITGYTSSVALLNRKLFLSVFVNNRLVESAIIRRAIDIVYSGFLPGGNRPFTVLFITVPSDRVDVNIHPTKHEVCLLDEELIVARLSESLRVVLTESAARRQVDARNVLSKATVLGERGSQPPKQQPLPPALTPNAVVPAPCTVVRTEPQRGALDAYFQRAAKEVRAPIKTEDKALSPDRNHRHDGCEKINNSVAIPSVEPERDDAIEPQRLAESMKAEPVVEVNSNTIASLSTIMHFGATDNGDDGDNEDNGTNLDEEEDGKYVMAHFKRQRIEIQDVLTTSTSAVGMHAKNADDDEIMSKGGTIALTDAGAGSVPEKLIEMDYDSHNGLLLTSVSTIVSLIYQATSPTAQSLFENLVYVGVVNESMFLAQSGTTLYAVNTLRLVRLVVYQRLFLRWAVASLPAPPKVVLQEPVSVSDLLQFALQNDVQPAQGGESHESMNQVVHRMDRRLRSWRCMLLEYFSIEITEGGQLLALPLGMNASWPPAPRIVPLFLWKLASEVPYRDGEVTCFTAIAHHVADTLYGLRLHNVWVRSSPLLSSCGNHDDAVDGDQSGIPSLVDAIRFGLVPCATNMKFFVPPADALIDGTLQSVVSVEELYKVFERC